MGKVGIIMPSFFVSGSLSRKASLATHTPLSLTNVLTVGLTLYTPSVETTSYGPKLRFFKS